jgi:threonine dehydrogenase-like Zn-dependent dehydrogenase
MRAAVITASRQVEVIRTITLPQPRANEVRIRLEGCGVCASSLPVWEGRDWFTYPLAPGAPGHEGWGVVAALGDGVENVRAGDRVAFLSGNAFAEYDIAPASSLVVLPPELDDRLFPGEAIGCAMNIFRRSDISAGQTVTVIGAGFLGNLLIQLAKHAGARVIAISRRDSARELARTSGADETIPMTDHAEITGRVRELTGNRGSERVIECVGSQWPLDIANDIIAERGRLVIAGYHQDGTRQVNMQNWNWLGIDVVNAHEREPASYVQGMQEGVEAVISGRIDPSPLLTHTFPLEQLDRAMVALAERPDGFVKGMVTF